MLRSGLVHVFSGLVHAILSIFRAFLAQNADFWRKKAFYLPASLRFLGILFGVP